MQRARSDEAKDERRQAFLNAALDEFFDRGFTAARMDDIARRAGVSKGALYLYFDSKEALFAALVETVAVPNLEIIERSVAEAPSAVEAIRAMLRLAPYLIRTSDLPRLMKVLVGDSRAFPDVVTRYRQDVIDRVMGAVISMLARGRDNGEFEIADPQLTARLVAAPSLFSAMWRVVFEHDPEARVDLDALFALHERMLLKGLGAQEEAAP